MELRGNSVQLRPLCEDDASALAAAAAENRENYKFNPVPDGIDEAKEYIARALDQREQQQRMPFTIVFHNRLVGTTSYGGLEVWSWPKASPLQRVSTPDVVEIGYTWLAHSAQRTSCNTEAKWLLLRHAFDTWDVHRVAFRTDKRNRRSRRAIERLGARFEGIRRADMPSVDGTVRDSAFYSIIRSEWPEVNERLQTLLDAYKHR